MRRHHTDDAVTTPTTTLPLRGQGRRHIRTIRTDHDGTVCILSDGQHRINSNPDDASLQVGTGKELDEAAARHVLKELLGDYSVSGNFPVTLTSAFTAMGMATPTELPNDAGTGHGRPGPPRKTTELNPAEARLIARATALVAGALLDELDGG